MAVTTRDWRPVASLMSSSCDPTCSSVPVGRVRRGAVATARADAATAHPSCSPCPQTCPRRSTKCWAQCSGSSRNSCRTPGARRPLPRQRGARAASQRQARTVVSSVARVSAPSTTPPCTAGAPPSASRSRLAVAAGNAHLEQHTADRGARLLGLRRPRAGARKHHVPAWRRVSTHPLWPGRGSRLARRPTSWRGRS